ncbi:hypothetical protein AB0C40_20885 [Streptomyces brevispora]|uniref:hypothetical protein n=1 Tax=Streptomyces brevispora TaxID=887462 RepID=UPI0034099A1F
MTGPTNASGNAVLVNALSSSVRSTINGMESVPGLVRQVLQEGSWRSFTTPRGEHVAHETFESFITAKPSKGLGYSVDELVRILTDDRETLHMVVDELGGSPAAVPMGSPSQAHQESGDDQGFWVEPGQEVPAPDESPWRDPSDDAAAPAAVDEPGLDPSGPVNRDALDLRTVGKSGGWIWAFKVARNVDPTSPGGRPSREENLGARPGSEKVSAAEFARRVGWDHKRVMRYYRAWEEGIRTLDLPHFDSLQPGVDVPLPAASTWSACFTSGLVSKERATALAAGAEEAGLSMRGVVYAAKSPGAMKAAILADPSTAEAARVALLERAQSDDELRSQLVQDIAHDEVFRKAYSSEARVSAQTDRLRKIVEDGSVLTPAGQVIVIPAPLHQEVAEHLGLEDWSGQELKREEWAARTSEEIDELVSKRIEADPEIKAGEQRAEAHGVVSRTHKSLQKIASLPLEEIADDELRESIASLGEAAEALALMVQKPPLRAV